MSRLVEQITAVSPLHPYFNTNERWVVGVSGGPDSLALLHTLRQIVGPERLIVAHLNHMLRPTATAEAEFVAQTAVSWQIPHYQQSRDVAALARSEGLSLEAAGRQARYHFLLDVARQTEASLIAVGHHADDQLETILLHLLRGTGLAGLRGMEMIRPLTPTHTLIRPLLHSRRADIIAYCQAHQLQPRHDESNQDLQFRRNWVRHQLLPQLAHVNPQIDRHLLQLAELIAADVAWLNTLTAEQWPTIVQAVTADYLILDRAMWQEQPLALRRRLLRRAAQQLAPQAELSFRALEQARLLAEADQSGKTAVLPQQIQLDVEYDRLVLRRETAVLPLHAPQLATTDPIPLPVPGYVALDNGWYVETAVISQPHLAIIEANPDPWTAYIDGAQAGQLWLRPRQPGEKMQPLGLNGRSAKLKEIMINRKIPAPQRAAWPIVATMDQPIWLMGHFIDERVRVTAVTPTVWQITCHPPE